MKRMLSMLLAVSVLLLGTPKVGRATDDGTPSTGNFTVVNVAPLSPASASGSLTIVDVTTLIGTIANVGPYQFRAGVDYQPGLTTTATATNLAAAINASGAANLVSAVGSGADVDLTAVVSGALYNSVSLATSNTGEITVSGAHLTGGQNAAVVTINGVNLVEGRDWYALDTPADTAINISAAINQNNRLRQIINSQWQGGSSGEVLLRSIMTPAAYPLATSDATDLSVSGATMTGGTAGNLGFNPCFLGVVNALPTSGYPAGCLAYLSSDATHIYLSTQPVTGSGSWTAK